MKKATATMNDGLKGSTGCGAWNSSGSFAFAQRLSDLSRVKWVMEKTAAGRLGKRLIVFRFPTTPAATAADGI